ncbi:hypothetical protein WN51_12264 [Melipona quadrifasciata]|uniref:Uncharacterized protein n=1 Tax=Melipona quadrifasciata TaxID=166423 RepID=A0A0M9A1P3_9HYME|nr:hypothetical protein WN51_12264 [Melipona quadrifasciata]
MPAPFLIRRIGRFRRCSFDAVAACDPGPKVVTQRSNETPIGRDESHCMAIL